jgi:hypothetical protein
MAGITVSQRSEHSGPEMSGGAGQCAAVPAA